MSRSNWHKETPPEERRNYELIVFVVFYILTKTEISAPSSSLLWQLQLAEAILSFRS